MATTQRPRTIGVVMAGAVAQGAFEAGVIQALGECEGIRIARIVAASAGALNAVVLAAGVCRGSAAGGALALEGLWREHATWREVLSPSPRHWLTRDGLLGQDGILKLLRDNVVPLDAPTAAEIELRLIVAPLRGTEGEIRRTRPDGTLEREPATTFEAFREFTAVDFTSDERLAAVFTAATASAAFPLVFAPVELDGLGPCIDGGAVNNTPIKWALEVPSGQPLDAVVVLATSVQHHTIAADELHGARLASHLAETLIGERLYRDLREAEQTNTALVQLGALARSGVLTERQHDEVLAALGWTDRRPVPLISIRPVEPLRNNAFAGFFSSSLRSEHYDLGLARGRDVLRAAGWLG